MVALPPLRDRTTFRSSGAPAYSPDALAGIKIAETTPDRRIGSEFAP